MTRPLSDAERVNGRIAKWPAPRIHDNPQPVVVAAMNRARSLVCLVRDEGPESIGALLDRCTPDDLYALATVLACMVPDDRTMKELLTWVDEPARPRTLEAV